jgi:hypothetical protein
VVNTTNPYHIGVAEDPATKQTDAMSQMHQFAREEDQAKAPYILPDPLEHVNPILSNIFVSLVQLRGLLKQSQNNPSVNSDKIEVIVNKVDEINKEILDLPQYLATIKL